MTMRTKRELILTKIHCVIYKQFHPKYLKKIIRAIQIIQH